MLRRAVEWSERGTVEIKRVTRQPVLFSKYTGVAWCLYTFTKLLRSCKYACFIPEIYFDKHSECRSTPFYNYRLNFSVV